MEFNLAIGTYPAKTDVVVKKAIYFVVTGTPNARHNIWMPALAQHHYSLYIEFFT